MINQEQNCNHSPEVDANTLMQAAKLAIQQDKPIMLDYYASSINKAGARIVKTSEGENILYKSDEEFTSPLKRVFKTGNDMIAISNNSIYIIHGTIMA